MFNRGFLHRKIYELSMLNQIIYLTDEQTVK